MPYNTIIIDDNLEELNLIKELCNKLDAIKVINQFYNPINAINWLQNNKADLIISDIEMPDINGIELIKNLKHQPQVIFVSNHPQYALKSFEVQPIHYLTKPITLNQLLDAVNRLNNSVKILPNPFIYINQNKENIKLYINQILYVKSSGNFVEVFYNNNKYLVLSNLTRFLKQLNNPSFLRVHKTFAVNVNNINKYTKDHIIINKQVIPIGNIYRKDFLNLMNNFTIKRN